MQPLRMYSQKLRNSKLFSAVIWIALPSTAVIAATTLSSYKFNFERGECYEQKGKIQNDGKFEENSADQIWKV